MEDEKRFLKLYERIYFSFQTVYFLILLELENKLFEMKSLKLILIQKKQNRKEKIILLPALVVKTCSFTGRANI